MKKEVMRQSIHIVGIVFIAAAQILPKWQSVLMFLGIALAFIAYSFYVKRFKETIGLRRLLFFFERKKEVLPFAGAIWFYVGCFLSFLIFPLPIASASCAILAIGDALSVLVGKGIGRHKINGNKTLEGSLAFVVGGFLISLVWINPLYALIAAVVGAVIELFVNSKSVFVNDNWIIPVVVGFVIFLLP